MDFTFKGIKASTLGVQMTEEWLDSIPGTKYEEIEIEGRDGSIFTPLNYQNVRRDISLILKNSARKADVMAWLTGSGDLVINGRTRKMMIYDQTDFTRVGLDHESFAVSAILSPFWTLSDDGWTNTQTTAENAGNAPAKPLIRATGSGRATFTINGITVGINFSETPAGTIDIDCQDKSEEFPLAVTIGYEYPTLNPGTNYISTTGTISLKMKRKDWWIG